MKKKRENQVSIGGGIKYTGLSLALALSFTLLASSPLAKVLSSLYIIHTLSLSLSLLSHSLSYIVPFIFIFLCLPGLSLVSAGNASMINGTGINNAQLPLSPRTVAHSKNRRVCCSRCTFRVDNSTRRFLHLHSSEFHRCNPNGRSRFFTVRND